MLSLKIKNLEDISILEHKLSGLAESFLKTTAKSYYKFIHDDIDSGKAFTPRTGNLQQSIQIRVEKDKAVISTNQDYAAFVEFGTKQHMIKAKNRKALSIPTDDGFIFVKSVIHPGSKPYPFMFLNFEERLKRATEEARNMLKGYYG